MAASTLLHVQPINTSVSAAGTTETVIGVSDILPTNVGGEGYAVFMEIGNIIGNASASTCRVRIRQGNGITGTVVADSGPNTVPAGANFSTSCGGVDGNPVSQYCATIQNSAAAQAGTSTGMLAVGFATSAIQ